MTRASYWLIGVLLLPLALLGGCGGEAARSVTVGNAENNRAVEISQGGTLTVQLEGNPTTGYTWTVAGGLDNHLRSLGDPEFKPSKAVPGAPGVQVLRFEAGTPGAAVLRLEYLRPFEKSKPPEKIFRLTVNVVDE